MKGKIFVVDDDPKIGRLLKFKLSRADYDAEYFNSAASALEEIPNLKPNLIISDIQMPKMNGYDFCERLRQDARTANIPFIFLSGKTDTSDQLEGLRLGADDYVCKPVKIDFLMERMGKVLERANKAKSFKSLADFSGNLSQMSLNDVMQIVEANHKTGELEFALDDGSILGRILFRKGNLLKAQFGQLEGAEAFYGLMDEAEGFFEFFAREINDPEQITITNMAALLQGSRLIDEAKGFYTMVPDLKTGFTIQSRNISEEVEDRFGKERIERILAMIEKQYSAEDILGCGKMSRPRAAAMLAELLNRETVVISDISAGNEDALSGRDADIAIESWLVKVLRNIEENGKTGALEISKRPVREVIFCHEGRIVNAFHGTATGKKALYRIFSEKGGAPKFEDQPVVVNHNISDDLDYLLEDGDREVETLKLLRKVSFNNRITVRQQYMEKVSRIKTRPGLKEVLTLVLQFGQVQDVIDASPLTDLRTYNHLLTMVKIGVIEIEKGGQ